MYFSSIDEVVETEMKNEIFLRFGKEIIKIPRFRTELFRNISPVFR